MAPPPAPTPSATLLRLALPVLALALALATTSGEAAVPPRAAVLVVAVGGFAWLAGRGGPAPRPLLDVPLAAAMGVAAGHVFLDRRLPLGHDTLQHLWGTWATWRELAAGDPFPRWVHDLGLGMPLLQFYSPASLAAAAPFAALGLPWPWPFALALVAFGAAAAVAMYAAVVAATRDRRAALVAAAAYAFAPYRLLDAGYRAAYAETAAMAVLPLVLFAGAAACRAGGGRRVTLAALPAALLLLTHPLIAITAAVGIAAWAATDAWRSPGGAWRRLGRAAVRLAAVWALATGLAGFFVVPFVSEVAFTRLPQITAAGAVNQASRHALSVGDLLQRRRWSGLAESRPRVEGRRPEGAPRMPFYFGAVLLALVPLAAWRGPAGRRDAGEPDSAAGASTAFARDRGLPAGLLVMTALALALSLHPVAGWAERVVPLLGKLQFAWRFLGVATTGAAAAAGFAVARLLHAADGGAGNTGGGAAGGGAAGGGAAGGGADRAAGDAPGPASLRPSGGRFAAVVPGAIVALLVLDAAPSTGAGDRLPAWERFGHLQRRAGCTAPAGCLEHVELPPPLPPRVAGYFLPPPDPGVDVGFLWWAYPELLTPTVHERYLGPPTPRSLAAAGVGAYALPDRPLRRLRAAPWARWRPSRPGGRLQERTGRRGGGAIEVAHDGRPGTIEVLEQYFPGWQVLTAGGWREVEPGPQGLLRAPVRRGQREVRFRFDGRRWDRLLGWLATALAVAVGAAATIPRPPARSSQPPPAAAGQPD